ncbi:molybdenum cofactor guanylyltransferase MobA [Alkalilimnicola ehrlichii MLHE-1]|uniref:Molybdenum cofactor guanylyltransferase n=1 Tax=Alkalilimnicola ehrlichii (strain ATCC BAA-1101 / DSM 17681 / MLHE-1) TaxID=187272 RepID=Q0A934_ALKEH|nr:molybdenum cofactor guanylyltransferase MobA [Alkalilimnicola ehrlichii]ABI56653.1 molybdenum cofactor guanylyltransferase [Alkalilimnicola ehrlichii MLHE-1]
MPDTASSSQARPARQPGITGVVLSGGRARRMGGQDKGLLPLAGQPMIHWVLRALCPQVQRVLINANRHLYRYRALGHPVVEDSLPDYPGPLAGMLSGMEAAATEFIAIVPCDAPLLPHDLVKRLADARTRERADIATAYGAGRLQPTFALIRCDLAGDLRAYLTAGEGKIDRWYRRHRLAVVDLEAPPEAFLNVNTPNELAILDQRLREE